MTLERLTIKERGISRTHAFPVVTTPVGAVQLRDHHSLGRGGMDKPSPAHVDTHMTLAPTGLEKYQITGAQFVLGNIMAHGRQADGGTRHPLTEDIPVGDVNKTGAVDAPLAQSPVYIRRSPPGLEMGLQASLEITLIGRLAYGNGSARRTGRCGGLRGAATQQ